MRRGTKLPELSLVDRARWAYSLAVDIELECRHSVTDGQIEHCGSSRKDVEELIDGLSDAGALTVMRSGPGKKSWFRIKDI